MAQRQASRRTALFRALSIVAAGLLGLIPQLGWSQASPECITADAICSDTLVRSTPSFTEGADTTEIQPGFSSTCLPGGEVGSEWYFIEIQQGGNFGFQLIPNDPNANYDFVLFDHDVAECDRIGTSSANVVSCNASTTPGLTGANGSTTFNYLGPGSPANPNQNDLIPVTAGQTLILYVSNASGDSAGYSLDLNLPNSDSVVTDSVPPQYASIPVTPGCDNDTVGVAFSEPVLCNSVDPIDFQLNGPGGPYNIINVIGEQCTIDSATFQDTFEVVVSPAIGPNGAYNLQFTGQVTDKCGNVSTGTGATLFNVNKPSVQIDSIETVFCGDDTLTVRFTDSLDCVSIQANDFQLFDPAGNSLNIQGVYSLPCDSNTSTHTQQVKLHLAQGLDSLGAQYDLQIRSNQIRDLCSNPNTSLQDSFAIADTIRATAGPDTFFCRNSGGVQLQGGGSGAPNLKFQWSPTLGLSQGNVPRPIANPAQTRQYRLRAYNKSCFSQPDTVVVQNVPRPSVTVKGDMTICRGDTATIYGVGGNGTYAWVEQSDTTDSITVSPLTTTTYNVVPLDPRCNGDTVSYTVEVTQPPSGDIVVADSLCAQADTVQVSFTGNFNPQVAVPNWDFDGGIPISGTGFGPYQVYWPKGGVRQIELKTNTFGCKRTFREDVVSIPKPKISAGPDQHLCEGNAGVTLTASAQTPYACSYSWFPDSLVGNPIAQSTIVFPDSSRDFAVSASCAGCLSDTDSVHVRVTPKPQANIASSQVTVCKGQAGVTLPGSGSGGSGSLSYEWFPKRGLSNYFVPTPTANPDSTTQYFMIVTDSTNCEADTAFVNVVVEDLPAADAGNDIFICDSAGGDTLSGRVVNPAFGSYSYSWSPQKGLASPNQANTYANPDTTTTYTLTVTSNQTGCSSASTIKDTLARATVFVKATPTAVAGPDTSICQGNSVRIGDQPQGAGPDYSYQWTPNVGLSSDTVRRPFADPSSTTTYFVTASSNGCTSPADSITVRVQPAPDVSINTPDTTVCTGDSIRLDVDVAGSDSIPYTYRWLPRAGLSNRNLKEPKVAPPKDTTYVLSVTSNVCRSPIQDSITLTLRERPQVNLNPGGEPINVCREDSVQLQANVSAPGPFDISWTPSAALGDSTILNPMASPEQSTNYRLTATYQGCPQTDSARVTVSEPVEAQIDADTNTICNGQTVRLLSETQPPVIYEWTPANSLTTRSDSSAVIAQPDTTTTYQLKVRRDICTDSTTVRIRVAPQPEAAFDYSYGDICQNSRVQFHDQSTMDVRSWRWEFGDGVTSNRKHPSHVYEEPGDYTVRLTVRAAGTCRDSAATAQQLTISPRVDASFYSMPDLADTLYLPNARVRLTNTSNNADNATWFFGDGQIARSFNAQHTYEAAGTYDLRLLVTDAAGCKDDTVAKNIVVRKPALQLTNVFTPNGDGMNDRWPANYQGNEDLQLQIYDRWGNQVYASDDLTPGWDGTRGGGGEPVPEGTYFYRLRIGDKTYKGEITLLR